MKDFSSNHSQQFFPRKLKTLKDIFNSFFHHTTHSSPFKPFLFRRMPKKKPSANLSNTRFLYPHSKLVAIPFVKSQCSLSSSPIRSNIAIQHRRKTTTSASQKPPALMANTLHGLIRLAEPKPFRVPAVIATRHIRY